MASARALKERLGNEGMEGLHIVISDAGRQWKDDVLVIVAERFERRLAEEIGKLRAEMAAEFGRLRADMAKELGAVRVEMANNMATMVKWLFLFWISQLAANTAMMAFLLKALGPQ